MSPEHEPTNADETEAVRRLLAPLRDAPAPSLDEARRARVWARIQPALAQPPSRWRAVAGWTALTAAAAAAVFLMWPRADVVEPPPPTVVERVEAMRDLQLAGETRLPSGAVARASGEVRLASADTRSTRIVIGHGTVENQVPALRPGESYVVESPLAHVEVRGTRFEVSHRGDRTRVLVSEGRVEVRPRDALRAPVFLNAGEALTLEPVTRAGARAAETSGDGAQAAAIFRLLADAAETDLERRNLLLRAGRLLDRHAPERAAALWAEWSAAFPSGPHADEFAYRAALVLRAAGQVEAAREAAKRFRERFPESPRVEETRGW